ncbi:hypothetical protein [Nitrobacter hamburgensis]|nr:hypothetical protein [Nitrobacter hamburgensis]
MHEAYAGTAGSPKKGSDRLGNVFPSLSTISPLQAAITNVFKVKQPHKTWALIANTLKVSERTAKHRVANARAYTVEELQVILQGENGLEFLNVLMADAEPRWWWWAKRVMAIAARRRQAAEIDQEILKLETSPLAEAGARRRIKGDIDASKNVGAKLARAETALGFLAPNTDRAGRGAMAPTKAQTVRTVGGRGR